MKKLNIISHLSAFFTIFVWGITFINTKVLLNDFSAMEILFVRYLIAYIILVCICPKPVKAKNLKDELYLFVAAMSGAAVYQYLENLSVNYTNPASVSFITALAPIFTAVLAHFYASERLTAKNLIGMLVAIVGVFLVSFGDSKTIETGLFGDVIIFLTVWLWAVYSIVVKKIGEKGYNGLGVTRRILFYSLIVMIPFMAFKVDTFKYTALLDISNILNLLYLGLFASAICFTTWNYSVKTLGATVTGKYLFVMPLITLIAQAFYDSSTIGIYAILGMFIIMIGIYISER